MPDPETSDSKNDIPPSDEDRRRIIHELKERVKELTVLHGAAELLHHATSFHSSLLVDLAELLPPGFQFPEVCAARIAWGEHEGATAGWRPSLWKLAADFEANGVAGVVEVAYYDPPIVGANDPFLNEERTLLKSLAEFISNYLEHQCAVSELELREAEYRGIFENSVIGIATIFRSGVPATANPSLQRMLGYSGAELAQMPFAQFTHAEDIEAELQLFRELFAGEREYYQLDKRFLRRDGKIVWGRLTASLIRGGPAGARCLALVEDVTAQMQAEAERLQLEAQLMQAQKMEAIGRLAGGIAHDFNNLLTIINGYSEYLAESAPESDPAQEMLNEINNAGERAATLTRQLLAFSRQTVLEPKLIDANHAISELEKMLRRLIGEDIELTAKFARDLPLVKTDPHLLEQAITNLVVNARDAMPHGGELSIETLAAIVEPGFDAAAVPPGRYVIIAVTDTGIGMTKEIKAKVFEPFFTTKEASKGTGLGLPMVFGFVKQSGGHIVVESEPGRGATFQLYLPAVDGTATAEAPVRFRLPAEGRATILLVEDEAVVRKFAKMVLSKAGYEVLEAGGARDALRIVEDRPASVDLLITDVIMPQGSGRKLADRLRLTHPKIKILYVSGYTDDEVVRHGILQDEVNFLQKPFSSTSLANKVAEVLKKARSASADRERSSGASEG